MFEPLVGEDVKVFVEERFDRRLRNRGAVAELEARRRFVRRPKNGRVLRFFRFERRERAEDFGQRGVDASRFARERVSFDSRFAVGLLAEKEREGELRRNFR